MFSNAYDAEPFKKDSWPYQQEAIEQDEKKSFQGTNALAYLSLASVTQKKFYNPANSASVVSSTFNC
jgi:hypothetical protein